MNNISFSISASTTDLELENIRYSDMRREARERRDDAAAVQSEQGDQEVLEYQEMDDGVVVLHSPVFGYALVNQRSTGEGDSMLIENGQADSVEHAVSVWRVANAT